MPGYIIHLAEAERIIEKISGNFSVTDDWKNKILTGCLLPDTNPYGKISVKLIFGMKKLLRILQEYLIQKYFLKSIKINLKIL